MTLSLGTELGRKFPKVNERRTTDTQQADRIIRISEGLAVQQIILARVEESLNHHKDRDEKREAREVVWHEEVLAEVIKCSEEGRVKDLQNSVTVNSNDILRIDTSWKTARNIYVITLIGVGAIFGALRLFT